MKKISTTLLLLLFGLNCNWEVFAKANQDPFKEEVFLVNQIYQGSFQTDMFPGGKIYYETQENPKYTLITLILEYKDKNLTVKKTIDEYEDDGGPPEVMSIFSCPIKNENYIFTIVRWRQYHRALGMDEYDYQIFAYKKNKDGSLSVDNKISDDPKLSGTDNFSPIKRRYFKYKTADRVIQYLKQKYHLYPDQSHCHKSHP